MDCDLYVENATSFISFLLSSIHPNVHNDPGHRDEISQSWNSNETEDFLIAQTFKVIREVTTRQSASAPLMTSRGIIHLLTLVVIPLAALGMIGNLLNIFVLTRKQLLISMDRMEKSVNVGLVALAVSDFLFCLFFLAASSPEKAMYSPLEYSVFYYFRLYQEALLNVLQLSSTWLTVNMAVGRYFAICKPLHARGFISLKGTRVAVVCVFVGSILINMPRFFYYHFEKVPCTEIILGPPEQENISSEIILSSFHPSYATHADIRYVSSISSSQPPLLPSKRHLGLVIPAKGESLPALQRYPIIWDEFSDTQSLPAPIPVASRPLMEMTKESKLRNLFWKRKIFSLNVTSLIEEDAGSRKFLGVDEVNDEEDVVDENIYLDDDNDDRDDNRDKNQAKDLDELCGCHFLIKKTSKLLTKSSYILSYGMASSVISIFLPLLILSACNVCLIRALRHSYRMQALYRANKPKANSGHRITATLIALIVLFIIFVTPADLVVFARLAADVGKFRSYELLTHLANLFLLTNFSLNFILYCVVNAQFRATVRYLVTCGLRCCSSEKLEGFHGGGGWRGRNISGDKLRMTEISTIDRQKVNDKSKSRHFQKSLSNSFLSSVPSVPMVTMVSEACTFTDMDL